MSAQVTIAVIGKGRLGTSFARAIAKKHDGFSLFAHIPARSKSFQVLGRNGGPDALIITAKDDKIATVAKKALVCCGPKTKIIIHCAGSLSSKILPMREGCARLMLHPIQTFATADPEVFKSISFGMETDDRYAVTFARTFIKFIGGTQLIRLTQSQLPIYHSLMVVASNFITLLGLSTEELSRKLGIPVSQMKRALSPLMQTALKNVLESDARSVLTGPIARSDKKTISAHRKALAETKTRALYDAFIVFSNRSL